MPSASSSGRQPLQMSFVPLSMNTTFAASAHKVPNSQTNHPNHPPSSKDNLVKHKTGEGQDQNNSTWHSMCPQCR